MALKKTLLQIVKGILSDMDSEDVNTISESVEAQQVASIVEDTFYEIVTTRLIPEHKGLIKLTAAADSATPTHFTYPTNVTDIEHVWYDKSDDGSFEYRPVYWMDPIEFIEMIDARTTDYDSVLDQQAGTTLRIRNNSHPTYYTSFDDENIVMDSYKSTVDTTLQESKVRAFGTTTPTFSQTDSYVPDIDGVMFPYLIAEAKSKCFDILKSGSTPKIEQAARRQKSYIQNDLYNNERQNDRPRYGRK